MVDFIRKRLQVFVSSTYSDLIAERQAAVEAILTAGHIPAGMELFSAGDESQMEVIKQWIDESDVYLLILGGRYGSLDPKIGKSYTHLEYEYAISKNKPAFACVIKEDIIESRALSAGRLDLVEREQLGKLRDFREFVLTKIVRFWEDSKDIKISVGETLAHLSRRDDLVGWTRINEQVNMPALADEIARLSKENAALRKQVSDTKPETLIQGLTYEEIKTILDKEGVLTSIIAKKSKLSYLSSDEKENIPIINAMSSLGLFDFDDKYRYHFLNNYGQIFMNKVKFEQITSSNAKDQ
jgi:hypothetical protein